MHYDASDDQLTQLLQLSSRTPDESTVAPQMPVWDAQTGAPSHSATAIRNDALSRRVPMEEHGSACRNIPEQGAAAAIRRDIPTWLGAAANTCSDCD